METVPTAVTGERTLLSSQVSRTYKANVSAYVLKIEHVPSVLLNPGSSFLSGSNFQGGHTYHPTAPVCSHRVVVYPRAPSLLNTSSRADTVLERGTATTHGTSKYGAICLLSHVFCGGVLG